MYHYFKAKIGKIRCFSNFLNPFGQSTTKNSCLIFGCFFYHERNSRSLKLLFGRHGSQTSWNAWPMLCMGSHTRNFGMNSHSFLFEIHYVFLTKSITKMAIGVIYFVDLFLSLLQRNKFHKNFQSTLAKMSYLIYFPEKYYQLLMDTLDFKI